MEQNRIASSGHHGNHEARTARAGKSQAGQDGAATTPAAGDGFALLLAALGSGQPGLDGAVDASLGDALADGALQPDAAALPGATLLDQTQAQSQALPPDAATLAAMLAGVLPAAAGQLTPAAGGVAATVGVVGDSLAGRVGLGLVRPGQDTLVGQTALLDGAAETAALNGAVRGAGAGRGRAFGQQSWTLALQGAAAGAGAQQASGHAAAALPAALQTAVAQAHALAQTQAQGLAGAGAEHLSAVPGQAAAALAQPDAAAALAGQPLAVAGAGALGRGEGAGAPRLGDGHASGQLAEASQPGTEAVGDAAPADASTQAGADDLQEQLAERVAYWVHQKTQSAELTLGHDGRAVEVTVALKGDEAHVSFRSDHADARQWLDSSSAQLRDLLQREGLQLTGMSVGTTADGGAGGERGAAGGRSRQRHAQVQAAAPVGTAAGGAGRTGASAVDLFV